MTSEVLTSEDVSGARGGMLVAGLARLEQSLSFCDSALEDLRADPDLHVAFLSLLYDVLA